MLCALPLLLSYPAGHAVRVLTKFSAIVSEPSLSEQPPGCPGEVSIDYKTSHCIDMSAGGSGGQVEDQCCDNLRTCWRLIRERQELLANRFKLYMMHCGAHDKGVLEEQADS